MELPRFLAIFVTRRDDFFLDNMSLVGYLLNFWSILGFSGTQADGYNEIVCLPNQLADPPTPSLGDVMYPQRLKSVDKVSTSFHLVRNMHRVVRPAQASAAITII